MGSMTTLKALRDEKGWTQEYVARKLDVSARSVWLWENGKQPLRNRVEAIARLFDVAPDDLTFGEPEAQP